MKMETVRDLRNLTAAASVAILLLVSGCGGGGSNDTTFTAANEQPVTVGPGPSNNINLLFTTVQICTPGSASNCQSIDHVLVDTGSTGLRIISSVISPSLALPQQTGSGGNQLWECGQFATGFTWGSVRSADIRMAQELARSVPIQVIADPAFGVPASCSGIGSPLNTALDLGANGILGVGVFQQDCGSACALNVFAGAYYACISPSGCSPTQAGLAQQLQNPVGMFVSNNTNGVIISLPSVPASGTTAVSGSMIFGIGTQGNNGLINAQVITVNPNTGSFTTILSGRTYANSVVDSGSNALYFENASIPVCGSNPDFDCPGSTLNLSASLQGVSGPASIVNFSVANAEALFSNQTFFAFNNLAGPFSDATRFDWGLPFFYGRRVYTAIEGQATPAGAGPYIAF
jgi:hypothetical protein